MPVSRRTFLGLSAAAAVGATRHPEEWLDADPQQCDALPPSLAALSSRRAEASPISSDERAARIARAQRLMGQRQLAALLLTGGTSLEYFTAVRWGRPEPSPRVKPLPLSPSPYRERGTSGGLPAGGTPAPPALEHDLPLDRLGELIDRIPRRAHSGLKSPLSR